MEAEVTGIYIGADQYNTRVLTFKVDTPSGPIECKAMIDRRDIIDAPQGTWWPELNSAWETPQQGSVSSVRELPDRGGVPT